MEFYKNDFIQMVTSLAQNLLEHEIVLRLNIRGLVMLNLCLAWKRTVGDLSLTQSFLKRNMTLQSFTSILFIKSRTVLHICFYDNVSSGVILKFLIAFMG